MKFDSARVAAEAGKGTGKQRNSKKDSEIKLSGEKPNRIKSNTKVHSGKKGDEIIIQD